MSTDGRPSGHRSEKYIHIQQIYTMNDIITERYEAWLANAAADPDLIPELAAMDDAAKEDAFYRELDFGTGGLRGVIGAGTNRMNVYTVARASAGLADYVQTRREEAGKDPYAASIAISYDSRIKSDLFSRTAAAVFASKGIDVWLYPRLMPTPLLSYAVRALSCDAGVMITASHNPSKYNGYKVYGPDGCQITEKAAGQILECIRRIDTLRSWMAVSYNESGRPQGSIEYIPEQVCDAFMAEIRSQSVIPAGADIDRSVKIVYSPLNGTGLEPVTRALNEAGFTNITVVEEQREPDGNFPTCPYPNPEICEAMELGLQYCSKTGADLLLATDPDCDRIGVMCKDGNGYVRLNPNEVGILMLDFICRKMKRDGGGDISYTPVFMKTVVTTSMAEKVAERYGLKIKNTLTGFKYIGEQIEGLKANEEFIFGMEESCGYLSNPQIRDKDGVNAALLISFVAQECKDRGITLYKRMQELYREYGYYINVQKSYKFDGANGLSQMQSSINRIHKSMPERDGVMYVEEIDYSKGYRGLPLTNMVEYKLSDGGRFLIRPSGTEPKLKVYVEVEDRDLRGATEKYNNICKYISLILT